MVRESVQNIRIRHDSSVDALKRASGEPASGDRPKGGGFDDSAAELDRLRTSSLLAAGLAHEVANPLLSVIASLAEVEHVLPRLRATAGSANAERWESVADCVDQARLSADAIAEVIRDFQVFLRPASNRLERLVEAGPLVERAIRMVRPQIRMTANLQACIESTEPVKAPPSYVTQIALNLLLNATEALAGRDPKKSVIEVRLAREKDEIVLEVSDNGPGLEPAALAEVFEPHVTSKEAGTSLGLGLSICRALAERLGGSISVTSTPHERTCFRVVFPAAARGEALSG